MRRILLATSFAAKGIDWKSFPDNAGHKNFPGCFRCHDGKHLDDKGQAIRLQCTLCHALPEVVREDGARTVASTVSPDLEPPPSHAEPNFMHDHRSKMDDTCTMCHGPIKFGKDGGSFCSNPACHGRKWPNMNLDAEAREAAAPAVPAKTTSLATPLPVQSRAPGSRLADERHSTQENAARERFRAFPCCSRTFGTSAAGHDLPHGGSDRFRR